MKRTVLIVGLGMSPAVLTETVWALAHGARAVIPDEVVVLTTKSGKSRLCDEVLCGRPSVWEGMLRALKDEGASLDGKLVFGQTSIRVIPDANGNELEDLRTGEDNLRTADFMLRQIRQYTESSDTVVLTSIAGGRKTMSALLFSCMSLLGREEDRIYHILQASQYEGRPDAPKYGDGELFEVPFVRMRGWYQDRFQSIPPSYRTLVEKVQKAAPPAVRFPKIEVDAKKGTVRMDGRPVALSKTCFAALFLIARGCAMEDLHAELVKLHNGHEGDPRGWLGSFRDSSRFSHSDWVEDLRKTLSDLRKKLKTAGFDNPEALVPQRNGVSTFPCRKLVLLNDWRRRMSADIQELDA